MGNLIAADTVFDHPAFNDYPAETPVGGRLMSCSPHLDGMFVASPGSLDKDSANLVLTRNGNGDWSLNRTAAGAETYHIRCTLSDCGLLQRIGETYERGGFGSGDNPKAPPKGVAVADFFALYKSGVVALTSATLRLGKMVYSNAAAGGAPTQTDLVAATAIATANAANYAYQDVPGPSPYVFSVDDLSNVEIELTIVMASTGTLAIAGLGCHAYFNYT